MKCLISKTQGGTVKKEVVNFGGQLRTILIHRDLEKLLGLDNVESLIADIIILHLDSVIDRLSEFEEE